MAISASVTIGRRRVGLSSRRGITTGTLPTSWRGSTVPLTVRTEESTLSDRHTTLPQLIAPLFLADGGLETTLLFHYGLDLPDFAAFPLLDTVDGREHLQRYLTSYLDVAERYNLGIVIDTPTWRANSDWGARRGFDFARLDEVNRRSVVFVREHAGSRPGITVVVSGAIGPRGDGYVVDATMTVSEAGEYHGAQVQSFADADVDLISALTMTYPEEAAGVALACAERDVPVVISFTVETDGLLPSGVSLADAISFVDEATRRAPVYFMVNCAHPTHFASTFAIPGPWRHRVKGIRANASTLSHASLDAAEELDRGDPIALAAEYLALRAILPDLRVVGGCCGTDHEHIAALAAALR
jgi:S-methylmethionine-dependent homocysteine/selenocysteine methylase